MRELLEGKNTNITKKWIFFLKGGGEADWLGTSGPEEQYGGEFPGFTFGFTYSTLGVGETGNLEMSTGGKGQSNKTENF